MKRFLSIMLTVMLVLSSFVMVSASEDAFEVVKINDTYKHELDATYTGYYEVSADIFVTADVTAASISAADVVTEIEPETVGTWQTVKVNVINTPFDEVNFTVEGGAIYVKAIRVAELCKQNLVWEEDFEDGETGATFNDRYGNAKEHPSTFEIVEDYGGNETKVGKLYKPTYRYASTHYTDEGPIDTNTYDASKEANQVQDSFIINIPETGDADHIRLEFDAYNPERRKYNGNGIFQDTLIFAVADTRSTNSMYGSEVARVSLQPTTMKLNGKNVANLGASPAEKKDIAHNAETKKWNKVVYEAKRTKMEDGTTWQVDYSVTYGGVTETNTIEGAYANNFNRLFIAIDELYGGGFYIDNMKLYTMDDEMVNVHFEEDFEDGKVDLRLHDANGQNPDAVSTFTIAENIGERSGKVGDLYKASWRDQAATFDGIKGTNLFDYDNFFASLGNTTDVTEIKVEFDAYNPITRRYGGANQDALIFGVRSSNTGNIFGSSTLYAGIKENKSAIQPKQTLDADFTNDVNAPGKTWQPVVFEARKYMQDDVWCVDYSLTYGGVTKSRTLTGASEDSFGIIGFGMEDRFGGRFYIDNIKVTSEITESQLAELDLYYELVYEKSASVEINGEARIAYGAFNNKYEYKAQILDSEGNKLDIDNINFRLIGDVPENLSLDERTGVITVLGELPKDVHITLAAEFDNGSAPVATKKLTLQDSATYAADNRRFDTLIGHINNIYKYAGDNDTPLVAMVIDKITMKPGEWQDSEESEPYIPCDGASLSNFLRAVDSVGILTGDESYNKRVEDLARFYIEQDSASAENGLPHWGGHTVIDMNTLEYNEGKGYVLELKSHFPYIDPFFRVDPEYAEEMCIGAFTNFVVNPETMELTRHASYEDEIDKDFYEEATESYTIDTKGYEPIYTKNLGFYYTFMDVAMLQTELYNRTENENAINAAMKLYNSFWKATDPDTMINVPQNSTAGRYGDDYEHAEGIVDISAYRNEDGQPVDGKWWELDPLPGELTTTDYGDRWWNLMGEDLIAKGYVDAEKEWLIRECYLRTETMNMENALSYIQWPFVDAVGEDSPEGKLVIDRALRSTANYIDLAYDPSQHNFKQIFVDGTDITGFVVDRNGYGTIGVKGYEFKRIGAGAKDFAAATTNYMRGIKYPEYKRETDILWSFIQNHARHKGYGVLGKNFPGDEGIALNLNTTESDPNALLAMLYLYQATDNTDFLDFARKIADNIIEKNMDLGMFTNDKTKRYIYTGSTTGTYPFVFAILEATIRGEQDLLPSFYAVNTYREGPAYDPETGEDLGVVNDRDLYNKPMFFSEYDVKKGTFSNEKQTITIVKYPIAENNSIQYVTALYDGEGVLNNAVTNELSTEEYKVYSENEIELENKLVIPEDLIGPNFKVFVFNSAEGLRPLADMFTK